MGKSTGRRVTLSVAALGVLALTGATIIHWERLAEKWYLYRLRTGAKEAIPAIEALRQDPDEVVREAAEYAVGRLKGTGPVQ